MALPSLSLVPSGALRRKCVAMSSSSISGVIRSTNGISRASVESTGLPVCKPATSVSNTRRSASILLATRADNLSLSPKLTLAYETDSVNSISAVDTVSFSLMMGSTPRSSNFVIVLRRFKYLLRFEKSSSVSST